MKNKQKKNKPRKIHAKLAKKSEKAVSKNITGVVPMSDRVLVRPFTEEELNNNTTHYGIILPEAVKEEKSSQGKVLAVGEGRFDGGQLIPMRVKVGDTVIFSKYGYDEIKHNGEDLYLLKEDQILAIINK